MIDSGLLVTNSHVIEGDFVEHIRVTFPSAVGGSEPLRAKLLFEDRKREAEGLRNRFRGCDDGLPFARALRDVAVRDQIIRSSADVPAELRKGLDSVPVGQLTAPEITKLGVEMFAVCAKDAAKADNTPGKRQAKEALFAERFDQQAKKYLQELRRAALIELGPAAPK